MKDQQPTDQSAFADQPRALRAFDHALLAGIAIAITYGIATDPIGLTWGLLAVGFVGGIVIGGAVSRGAWAGLAHPTVRRLQALASVIAIGAWIVGLFIAYVSSQALYQQAATSLFERLSLGGFSDYFAGLFDQLRLVHAAALTTMAFMAWRGAR